MTNSLLDLLQNKPKDPETKKLNQTIINQSPTLQKFRDKLNTLNTKPIYLESTNNNPRSKPLDRLKAKINQSKDYKVNQLEQLEKAITTIKGDRTLSDLDKYNQIKDNRVRINDLKAELEPKPKTKPLPQKT